MVDFLNFDSMFKKRIVNYSPDYLKQLNLPCNILLRSNLMSECVPKGLRRACTAEKCPLRRKRGKRGGVRQKLKKRKHKVFLPVIMYGNVRSLNNKIDELKECMLLMTTNTEIAVSSSSLRPG